MDAANLDDAYRRYFPVIHGKCTRMLRDHAEAQDIAQETFTRLWENQTVLRDPGAAVGWIYRTATRLAVDRIRRRMVEVTLPREEAGSAPDAGRAFYAREELDRMRTRLSGREWEALLLSRVDGLTHDEIASVMQMSDRNVRRLLTKAAAGVEASRGSL